MRSIRILLASSCLAASSLVALAAATPEEAAQIKASFEKYLTNTPGIVTVTPNGDVYDVVLDAAPAIAKAGTQDVQVTVSPLHLTIKPLGNGQWQFDQKENLALSIKGKDVNIDYKFDNFNYSGVFDEALANATASTFSADTYAVEQDILDPTNNTRSKASSKVSGYKGSTTAVAGANGGSDLTFEYSAGEFNTAMEMTPPGVPAPIAINYKAVQGTAKGSGTGVRSKEILALVAWFVAHPTEQAIKAAQQELKPLLKAALPLWDNLKGDGSVSAVKIGSQFGDASIDSVGFAIDMNGLTKEGKFREAIDIKGLKLPAGILPPWSTRLIPSDVAIDFAISGFDASTTSNMVIDAMNLEADKPFPDELQATLMAAALPSGNLDITLNPGKIVAPAYVFSYEGNLKVNPMGLPAGTATVRLKGFDDVMKSLQEAAASDPSVQQAMGPLMVAKGFAKTEGDELVWAIESNGMGGVLVNGVDVTKM